MHDFDSIPARNHASDDLQVRGAHICVLSGRSVPKSAFIGDYRPHEVVRLERLVASCHDVDEVRFEGMTVNAHDGSRVRGVDVHAIVECRSFTCLTNVHADGQNAFWATVLLQAAAVQLGFISHVVTPMAVECSSPTFMTLIGVSCWQHVDLSAWDVERIAGVFETSRRPKLGDVQRALGGASHGRTGALAAVAHGLLRLSPHTRLTPSVRVDPGPMLEPIRSPSGGAATSSPALQDAFAA